VSNENSSSTSDVKDDAEATETEVETTDEVTEELEDGDEVVESDEDGTVEKVKTVPYSRLQEETQKNNILTKLLNNMNNRNLSPGQAQQKNENVLDKIQDPELKAAIQQQFEQERQGNLSMLSGVADKMDEQDARMNIPRYNDVKEHIEELKNEYANKGTYLKREDAYAILVARGVVKAGPNPKSKVATKVDKQRVRVATERSTSDNRQPSGKKEFKSLKVEEMEKALEGKSF